MLILEQVESVSKEKLEQQKVPHKTEHPKGTGDLQSNTVMQECVDERMKQDILDISHKISNAHNSYNDAEDLPIGEAVTNVADGFLEAIKDSKEKKVILSVQINPGRGLSVIDSLISKLNHLINKDDNIKRDDRGKLEPIWLEICSLVSKGNYVSEEMSKLLPNKILEERDNYLSGLKHIVCDSIEKGEEKDVTVKRDNAFYCVKCPEESVITPAKFLSNPEFQNLDGALKIGEGNNVIRLRNGQYHDMKGRVKMTFKVGDDEKIEMILSSEKAESFGKIMVHMDEKNREVFLKYREELEKEPRVSKVVEAAKSFVQMKSSEVSIPSSALENVSESQHSQSNSQELPAY